MTDVVSNERRSWIMSRVKSADTSPELAVRSMVHRLGYRFRLHRRDLPGAPDLVFPRYKKVVFVHGCFWHRHAGCRFATTPATNADFWARKFAGNVKRDAAKTALRSLGWPASYLGAHANTDPHITIGPMQYGPTPAAGGGGFPILGGSVVR